MYGKLLGEKYHRATFVSVGSCSEVEDLENQSIKIVCNILKSSEIIKFVDRDDKSDEEVGELKAKGVKTSKRRHIECYLLDDELISKLCLNLDKEELIAKCLQAKIPQLKAALVEVTLPMTLSRQAAIFSQKLRESLD